MKVEDSAGYKKLLAAVANDESRGTNFHDYRGKLHWIASRAKHYAEKTGLEAADILDSWEASRNYWYMNYYQECNQPEIKEGSVRIFDTTNDLLQSIGNDRFLCPHCDQVTTSPYECNSGAMVELMNYPGEKHPCNWKSYGFMGHLGKGVYVFVKEKMKGEKMFMPVAWLQTPECAVG